jgi:hypothetical protein
MPNREGLTDAKKSVSILNRDSPSITLLMQTKMLPASVVACLAKQGPIVSNVVPTAQPPAAQSVQQQREFLHSVYYRSADPPIIRETPEQIAHKVAAQRWADKLNQQSMKCSVPKCNVPNFNVRMFPM